MNADAITVNNLSRHFGSFVAVDGISFAVKTGEIFGFLGPNGAGKSTTIKMLCGILRPSEGSGTVAGYDINKKAEEIKKHIGYMSQRFSLYPDLTAEENMDFFAGIYGVPLRERKFRKDEICDLVGLQERRGDLTSLLTGGWRQRLALACALIHNPPIIFLDEPTSGVDPISRRDFWGTIQKLSSRGITTLVTTHYMEEAEYCQRLALISGGRLIAEGTPEELKRSFEYGILYVECSDLIKALELLSRDPSFVETSLWGSGLHIVTSEKEAEERVAGVLGAGGISLKAIRPARVSLEDVFVYKISEGKRE